MNPWESLRVYIAIGNTHIYSYNTRVNEGGNDISRLDSFDINVDQVEVGSGRGEAKEGREVKSNVATPQSALLAATAQCSAAFIHGANLNALPSCPPLQLVRVLTCSAVKSCNTRQWCI